MSSNDTSNKLTSKKSRNSKKSTIKRKMKYNISDFYGDLINDNQNMIEIGRGGQGIVYYSNKNKDSVYKVSSSMDNCRKWDIEVTKYNIINSFNINTNYIKLLRMKHYLLREDSETCILELNRVVNPLELEADYTIQPLFGLENQEQMYVGRGLFLGVNNLLQYDLLTQKEIIKLVSELGIVMARLHYQIKIDCFDVELFLGIEKNKKVIYIGDFDLSNFILYGYNEEERNKLLESLTLVEYFPTYDETPELFELFSNNYILEATKYNGKKIAIDIINNFREY